MGSLQIHFNFSVLPGALEDFPDGSDGKASAYNAGDPGSISGLGRSPGNKLEFVSAPEEQYKVS